MIFRELSSKYGVNDELYEKNFLEWILETEKLEEEVKERLKKEIHR